MKLSIFGGGGCVGSAAAFHIGTLGLLDELVLIGRRQNVIEQHVLDLRTALAPLGVRVTAGANPADIAYSDVIINTAGVHQSVLNDPAQTFRENIALIKATAEHIAEYCPGAVVITVTNPIDAMNYATWRAASLERRQFLGYSLNDSLRFREFVARVKGAEVSQIEGVVVGEHGRTQVQLFSSVRIGGRKVSFSEDEKQAIRDEIPAFFKKNEALKTGRTAGWTCAVGLAAITRAVVKDTGELFAASAVLDGEYGLRGLSMGVPVRLGRGGIQKIEEWELAADERESLDNSARQLTGAARVVDEQLA
jgi:malate dehydrogenase